jgi:hypothetical protein
MVMRKLYDSLKLKIENGEKLEWNSITSEQLEELFCVEVLTDGIIADLFGVEKRVVTNQRKKWDISDARYSEKKAFEIYKEEVASALIDSPISWVQDITLYERVESIVKDIQNLSEEEHEILIGYLIKTNDKLRGMARDNIQYKAFYKAHTSGE